MESKHFRGMLMQHAEHCSLEFFFSSPLNTKAYGKLRAPARAEAYSHHEYIKYVYDYDAQLLVHLLAFHLISSLFDWCASARRWWIALCFIAHATKWRQGDVMRNDIRSFAACPSDGETHSTHEILEINGARRILHAKCVCLFWICCRVFAIG